MVRALQVKFFCIGFTFQIRKLRPLFIQSMVAAVYRCDSYHTMYIYVSVVLNSI